MNSIFTNLKFPDKFIKKVKLIENENNDYTTQEFELDIDIDSEQFIDDESK
uniref:Uncharacterized protein n=1 Tax=Rhizophagus irregularis (strain DAOM 181602 / DAOM 197198 / MUCL 43194) TaxID=747089 RepID=U9UMQ2_RHIID